MKRPSQNLALYEILHALNQGFEQILGQLENLKKLRVPAELLGPFRLIVQETRAGVNFEVVEILSAREERNWTLFGQLHRKWEKAVENPSGKKRYPNRTTRSH